MLSTYHPLDYHLCTVESLLSGQSGTYHCLMSVTKNCMNIYEVTDFNVQEMLLLSVSAEQLVGKVGCHCICVGCKIFNQLAAKW